MELLSFSNLAKANDCALWLSFTHRTREELFVVVHGPEDDFVVIKQADAKEHDLPIIGPKFHDYSLVEYGHIQSIRTDEKPLKHFEEITGAISSLDSEFLRYIIKMNLPIEKLIRYELAIRGYDENGNWVGFEKAKEIWLT